MKKNSNYPIRTTMGLIVTAVLILNLGQGLQTIERNERDLSLSSLIPHDPIYIISDGNFTDYGFPGSGTVKEPYVIEGYNITTTSQNGIYVYGTTKYFIVCNCYVDANDYGIYIRNVADGTATVINNTCSNNDENGIYLYSSGSLNVTNNTCSNNKYGIYLEGSSSSTVVNNTCSNNWEGIAIHSSGNSTVANNTCNNNNNKGIGISHSSSSTVANNTCNSNNYQGIRLWGSGNSTITNNTCNNNNNTGTELNHSNSLTVANNTCNSNNYIGIWLSYSDNSTVFNNTCNNNYNRGTLLYYSGSLTVVNNTCNNNWNGIELYNSDSSKVANNMCENNTWNGIFLHSSTFCVVTYNLLQENEEYGIYLFSSSDNNLIHHNNFVDNNLEGTSQGYDDCTNNTWYDTAKQEGNYWSDWSGIGNYSIDGDANSVDLYPLGIPVIAEYSQIVLVTLILSIVTLFLSGQSQRRERKK